MTIQEAILARHAVRSYTDQKIPEDVVSRLKAEIDTCNEQSGLHIQLVTDEPHAFDGMTVIGLFAGAVIFVSSFFYKEKSYLQKDEQYPFFQSLVTCFRNKSFLIFEIISFSITFIQTALMSVFGRSIRTRSSTPFSTKR